MKLKALKNKKKNTLLITIFVIVFLLSFLEIAVRIATKGYSRSGLKYDDELVWTYSRNEVIYNITTNDEGFRDKNHIENNLLNNTRIFLVGDSYTAGAELSLDKIFASLLEKRLGSDYEIFNLGISAYGTDQELLTMKRYLPIYNPDYVIVVIAPNDMRESYKKRLFYIDDEGNLIYNKNNKAYNLNLWKKIVLKLSEKSELFNVIQLNLGLRYGTFNYYFDDITEGVFLSEGGGDHELFLIEESQERKDAIILFKRLLIEMDNVSKENNSTLILVNLPIKLQFDGSLNDSIHDQYKVSDIILEVSKEKGIYYLDLYPLLQNKDDPLEYYIDEEYHLDEDGHKLVSEEIFRFLKNIKK